MIVSLKGSFFSLNILRASDLETNFFVNKDLVFIIFFISSSILMRSSEEITSSDSTS